MENQLIIRDNKTAKLLTENEELRASIHQALSFKFAGVEYQPRFQYGGWDGKTYLLTKKNEFPSGLVSFVEQIIKDNSQEVSIIDERKPIIDATPIDISERLAKLNMIPRDYQEDILIAAINNRKGIIRACTGSGKTLATAMITAKLNKPTILYVIGLDLLKQFYDLYSSIFDEKIGFIGNGVCDVQRINIASVWSIGKALDLKDIIVDTDEMDKEDFDITNKLSILNMLKQTKIHLFDECHLITCNTAKSVVKYIDPERIYGFSGTPYRDDNSDLLIQGILGDKIIDISASMLIERGVLVAPTIKFIAVPKDNGGMKNYQTVYKEYVVENDKRNQLIVNGTKTLIEKKYKPLVLFKQIKHGKILSELFDKAGIKYAMLYGNDTLDVRTAVKKEFIEGKIDVILASTIFDLGIDISCISALVLCGSGRSFVRTLQRIGRAIRGATGKQRVAVIDFYDQIKFLKKHSKIRYEIYKSEPGFDVIPCKEMKV